MRRQRNCREFLSAHSSSGTGIELYTVKADALSLEMLPPLLIIVTDSAGATLGGKDAHLLRI